MKSEKNPKIFDEASSFFRARAATEEIYARGLRKVAEMSLTSMESEASPSVHAAFEARTTALHTLCCQSSGKSYIGKTTN